MSKIICVFSKIYTISKLKNKLIISFSVLIFVLVLLIGLVMHIVMQRKFEEAEKNSLRMSMIQLNNSIDYFYEAYMGKTDMTFNNSELAHLIMKQNGDIAEATDSQRKIGGILGQLTSDLKYPEMKSSYYFGGYIKAKLFVDNDSLSSYAGDISAYSEIEDQEWCRKLFTESRTFSWESNVQYNNFNNIVLSRRLMDFNTVKDIAVLRLYIPITRLKNIIDSNIHDHIKSLLYVDENYKIITTSGDKKYTSSDFLDGIKHLKLSGNVVNTKVYGNTILIGSITSNITKWKLIFVTPTTYITEKTRFITSFTAFMIIISIIICILIATIISSFITRRIDILVEKTKSIASGDLSVNVKIKGNDEIAELDRCFNNMMEQINNLIQNDYKTKIIINKTKFELLQEQINPHLLYNTLSMICLISKRTNQLDVLNISQNLISFYKGILNKGRVISSISAELKMVRCYIEITRFVYDLEIDTVFDIEDGIEDCYSIKLLLQPIVENAIVHGIRPNKEGKLKITGKKFEKSIKFTVSDNGAGMEMDALERLQSDSCRQKNDKGYGLSNVIHRISLFFDDSYGVHIDSQVGEGTTVEISIPALNEAEIQKWLEDRYLQDII